mgnify:FL=1
MDDKNGVLAILEAVEWLISNSFEPTHTVYLAFGHDEEVGGAAGARNIAALLHSRHVELEFLVDEGTTVMRGGLPGIDDAIGMIGVSEKGAARVSLKYDARSSLRCC